MANKSEAATPLPDHVTGEVIAAFTGISRQRVAQLATENVIPKAKHGEGFPFQKSVRAIIDYRTRNTAAIEHKERKTKADADSAEMDAAEKAGELEVSGQRRHNFMDGIAQGVRNISRLKELTDAQKDAVFAALRAVKFEEDSE